MSRWLSVIGIGDDGLASLSPTAASLLNEAEVLFGGDRHLALIPDDGRPRRRWRSPLSETMQEILVLRGRRVAVLASGDPLWYGIGTKLLRHVPLGELIVVPAPSAFSLACARLGWSLADVETLTVHGRPLATVQPFVQPGARLLILSADGGTPAAIAEMLRLRRFGGSRMTVLEHMGGVEEAYQEGLAADWGADHRVADLNTLAIECIADPGARPLPRVPGLPDEAFVHDGQLTKREVRAVTLSSLAPGPGQVLWDVGAGSGAVGIEWLRSNRRSRAIAIERSADRRAMLAENAIALGCPQLELVAGEAPLAFDGLETPDAVFLGGGLSAPGLLEAAWNALKPGGRLVANVVTIEGEQRLFAWNAQKGGTLTRLQVARAESVGPLMGWRPLMPVTQYAGVKV